MGRRNRIGGLKLLATATAGYLGWQMLQRMREASLRGQVVLITGGSRGLGLQMAREFAREGCRLALCARDDLELDNAKRDLEGRGAEVMTTVCDVSRRPEVERWIAEVERTYGRVDVLVNNASIIQVGPLSAMTVDDFRQAMEITFFGALFAVDAVLPGMRERRSGRIVNITSIGGKVAVPHLLPYDCAKFALVGFSEGLRAELAKDGITVTTIVPGLMRTGSPPNAFFKGDQEKEFTWFSLGDATPLTAMNAGRAARRIVQATRRGEAEVTLTWQAKLLRLTHGVLPGATSEIMGWVNRVLPDAEGPTEAVRGMHLATAASPSPVTAMMNRAARENNEYGGRPEPAPDHARKAGVEQP